MIHPLQTAALHLPERRCSFHHGAEWLLGCGVLRALHATADGSAPPEPPVQLSGTRATHPRPPGRGTWLVFNVSDRSAGPITATHPVKRSRSHARHEVSGLQGPVGERPTSPLRPARGVGASPAAISVAALARVSCAR